MISAQEKSNMILKAIIEVAINPANSLPGGLGEQSPSNLNLKKLAEELCDAFEVVSKREASWQQGQQ
jgi:coenzyme F420-reducing hydrogenase alpha subunit